MAARLKRISSKGAEKWRNPHDRNEVLDLEDDVEHYEEMICLKATKNMAGRGFTKEDPTPEQMAVIAARIARITAIYRKSWHAKEERRRRTHMDYCDKDKLIDPKASNETPDKHWYAGGPSARYEDLDVQDEQMCIPCTNVSIDGGTLGNGKFRRLPGPGSMD